MSSNTLPVCPKTGSTSPSLTVHLCLHTALLREIGNDHKRHRLFCHITANWRGTPLTTYETIVDRIGNVRTATGLRVRAELDAGEYPTGVTVTKEEMDALALVPDAFHGEWNYKLLPR